MTSRDDIRDRVGGTSVRLTSTTISASVPSYATCGGTVQVPNILVVIAIINAINIITSDSSSSPRQLEKWL
jgi:hypothetical protein